MTSNTNSKNSVRETKTCEVCGLDYSRRTYLHRNDPRCVCMTCHDEAARDITTCDICGDATGLALLTDDYLIVCESCQ